MGADRPTRYVRRSHAGDPRGLDWIRRLGTASRPCDCRRSGRGVDRDLHAKPRERRSCANRSSGGGDLCGLPGVAREGRRRAVRHRAPVRPPLRRREGRARLGASPVARKADDAEHRALPRAGRTGSDARARARGRPRAAAVVAVGTGPGAGRRRLDWRTALRPHRALAPALPARVRGLAVRHPTRRGLDPRGADSLLRSRPVVSEQRRGSGLGVRSRQRQARRPSRAAR